MTRRNRLGIGVSLLLAVVGMGCGTSPIVGVLLPSSGDAATYGESIESGIRLAVSESREKGTLPSGFDVVWADTRSQPADALSELEKMAGERGIHLVVGGATSAEAQAIIPELERLDVVCLSPSASTPGLAQESRFFYRIYPSDELEGHTAAKFLHERLAQSRAVLYSGNAEYADGIEPEFRKQFEEALGGEVIAKIVLADEGWDEQSASILRSSGVEAVYIVGYAPETLSVLQHLAGLGYEGRVVTTSAFYSSRIIREAGPLAEGILFPLPPFDRTSEKEPVLSFVNRYMDTYQRAPDVFAAHGYDAMKFVIEVMKIANPPQTQEIKRAMQFGVTDFMGVTGPIIFDDYGDVKHYPKMFIVKDGQVLSYQRYLKTERARILREVQNLLIDKD
jgi:branched-chain amino acid transport system substrate-binding protein